ncbi:hypothetical protein [Saccharopolyspora hattusasensis]|uniref:hypothetical protein n=1 Tax=Saccharopolyspora hattusasensis TaxID=1128679 RepID=UPI003D98451C
MTAWWSGASVAGLVVLGLVVGGYAAAIRNAPGALGTAVLGWMFLNGFVFTVAGISHGKASATPCGWARSRVPRWRSRARPGRVGCLETNPDRLATC